MNKKYDAVIFDLDGTLIDSMWVWDEIDKVFLNEQGMQVPNDMDKELEGKSFTETAAYFKKRFKLALTEEEIKKRWNDLAWDFYIHKVKLKEGVKEFLDYLKHQGIKMGIATSNSIELSTAVLKALAIDSYFEKVLTACEVGRGKPFPDVYLKVSQCLGVEPKKCLVFEDIPNGVLAAQNAGMSVYAIEDRQDEKMKEKLKLLSDSYIKNYNEVLLEFMKA